MRFTLLVSLIISILAVIFALQNPQPMAVEVGTLNFEGSTALILLVTFAIGVVVGLLGALPGWIRNRRKVNSLRKTIADERVESVRRERTEKTTERHEPAAPPPESETTQAKETETRTESERKEDSSSS